MINLPYISSSLPGIGGVIREKSENFQVVEVPVYEPSGQGDHLYINFTKKDRTTKDVVDSIARILNLPFDFGIAGLKDKNAVTTQSISVLIKDKSEENLNNIKTKIESLGLKVNFMKFHSNKLKPGHLRGNKFIIKITQLSDINLAFEKADKIAELLRKTGVPNFYGEQRFSQDNVQQAQDLLAGKRINDRWLKRFLLSSYQSYLFNQYLTKRIEIGFDKLLIGDICKKHDTGGLFVVEDLENEQKRFDSNEISFTGPMYGQKLWFAEKESGNLEMQIIENSGLKEEQVARLGQGLRRVGRIILNDLSLEKAEDGLILSFFLPKGSYATIVLREFMKNQAII